MRKDIQKNRVYCWEDTLPFESIGIRGEKHCSMRRCRELIDAACKLYGLPLIPVRTTSAKSASYQEYFILIPKHFQRKDIALHEAAHYIVGELWKNSSDHGGIFVRVYMHLLHYLLDADYSWMESWARFHHVKFNTNKKYAPESKTLTPWEYSSLQMNINADGFLKKN